MKRSSKKAIILFLLLILAGSFFGYKEYNDPLNRIRRTGILMPKGYERLLSYVNAFIEREKDSGLIEMLANKYIYH